MFNETRFLLSTRNNPNSRVRANGIRWWGHPSRNSNITCIVLHTTENDPGNGVAMNVARWQASTAPVPSSYHKLVDTHNIVQTVLDNHTAFHAVNFNSRGLGVSFATRAARWGRNATADTRMLERGAWVVAEWCKRYNIPVRMITRAEGARGVRGILTHALVDPSRRSDPGRGFPLQRFLNLVRQYISGGGSRNYITTGDSGSEVRSWQRDLLEWDSRALPTFGADGDFGAETVRWTLRFMDSEGFNVSDRNAPRVGPNTRDAMKKALKRLAEKPPEPVDEWEVFWMSLNNREKAALEELAKALVADGVSPRSFVEQLLNRHRVDIPRVTKHVDRVEELLGRGDTSLRGVIVGGVNTIDAVRDLGYDITTTERTGPKKTS